MNEPEFRVVINEVSQDAKTIFVLHCEGQLDISSIKLMEDSVMPVVSKGKVVLDMSQVTLLDSSGLGKIVSLFYKADSLGSELVLSGLPEGIRQEFKLTKIDTKIKIFTDKASAVQQL